MTALSTETTAAIIFGVLQLSLNLMTFWEQRQTRRMQGKFVQEPFLLWVFMLIPVRAAHGW